MKAISKVSADWPGPQSDGASFLGKQGYFCNAERAVIRTEDHLAQFAALRAELGIGMCSSQLASRHGLVRVLPKLVDFKVGVWIAMHQDLRRVKRIASVFDTLAQSMSRFLRASE